MRAALSAPRAVGDIGGYNQLIKIAENGLTLVRADASQRGRSACNGVAVHAVHAVSRAPLNKALCANQRNARHAVVAQAPGLLRTIAGEAPALRFFETSDVSGVLQYQFL
jgi:hypothetical protein